MHRPTACSPIRPSPGDPVRLPRCPRLASHEETDCRRSQGHRQRDRDRAQPIFDRRVLPRKQYLKGGRAVRTESVVNDAYRVG